jgi:hypothetical protein
VLEECIGAKLPLHWFLLLAGGSGHFWNFYEKKKNLSFPIQSFFLHKNPRNNVVEVIPYSSFLIQETRDTISPRNIHNIMNLTVPFWTI